MNSSKVFKTDTQFTRIPLVKRELAQKAGDNAISSPTPTTDQVQPDGATEETEQLSQQQAASQQSEAQPEQQFSLEDIQAVKEEAYSQGVADASAQHQSALLHTIESFQQACQRVHSLHRNVLDHSREEVINLVIALSNKILSRELETGRDIIAATLQKVLDNAIESDEFIISVNPEDLALAEEKAPEFIASVRSLEHIVFKGDPGISRGGCQLESKICSVDATIETQLEASREFLEANSTVLLPPEPAPPDSDA